MKLFETQENLKGYERYGPYFKTPSRFYEADEPGDHNRVRAIGNCLIRYLVIICAILFVLWGTAQVVFNVLLRP